MRLDKDVKAFLKESNDDIEWRVAELATIKKNAFRKDQTEAAKIVQCRYSVPSIYAIWEGFVLANLNSYIQLINKKISFPENTKDGLMSFVLFDSLKLNAPPTLFEKKKEKAREIAAFFHSQLHVPKLERTNGNVNFKELMLLLRRYEIPDEGLAGYESGLNKFVRYRDQIAHGVKNVPVPDSLVSEFARLVEGLMSDVILKIEDAIKRKTFMTTS